MASISGFYSDRISYPIIDKFKYDYIVTHADQELPHVGDYFASCSNGFIKLYTQKGLEYWIGQAFSNHRNPDWKIHFSITQNDIPCAWDILASLFIKKKCRFGMKVFFGEKPVDMAGREITVYIYRHHPDYNFATAADEQNWDFWKNFIQEAEEALKLRGVTSNGLADGDAPLGMYASLRNEAYVPFSKEWKVPLQDLSGGDIFDPDLTSQWFYPPNEAGYNAAKQPEPF